MSTNIRTKLMYSKEDGKRAYYYARVRTEEERKTSRHKLDFDGV